MLVDLNAAFMEAEADDAVRVVILGGTGKMFSSGHDMGSAQAMEEYLPGPNQHPTAASNGGTRLGVEKRMLQEWHYFFENTLRWRNLRKITIAQMTGHGVRRRAHAHVGVRPHHRGRRRPLRRRGRDPARDVRGRVLRPSLGVRAAQDQGAHAHRRLDRRRGGPPARHGLQDLPGRRRRGPDPRLRPADRQAADRHRPPDQGVGQPDGRQHGLLQRPAGLLQPAPAQPRPLGRGDPRRAPGRHPEFGVPDWKDAPPVQLAEKDKVGA